MAHNNYDKIVNDSTETNDSINKPNNNNQIDDINDINNDQQKNIKSKKLTNQSITVDVHKGTPIRLQVKVPVPIDDHPNYNFVGKLLGPKGNSLKWLQEQTGTRMAILGRGSIRNKQKEEELRNTKLPKFSHLNEDLHVEITATAPAPEAYLKISNALFEIKRFLVPDYFDEIRQQQLRELGVLPTDDSGIKTQISKSPLLIHEETNYGDNYLNNNSNNVLKQRTCLNTPKQNNRIYDDYSKLANGNVVSHTNISNNVKSKFNQKFNYHQKSPLLSSSKLVTRSKINYNAIRPMPY